MLGISAQIADHLMTRIVFCFPSTLCKPVLQRVSTIQMQPRLFATTDRWFHDRGLMQGKPTELD
jgi:hypothetical protein